MQETVLVANMGGAGRWFRSHVQAKRAGANIGRTREIWPTKDGWVSFGLRGGKARIPSLETIGRLVDDPVLTERDWTTWDVTKASDADVDDVQRVVGEWFARHSTAELYEYACETNLMLAPVNSPRELYASAQLAAREFFDADGVPTQWAHIHVHPSPRRSRSGVDPAVFRRPSTPERGKGAWDGDADPRVRGGGGGADRDAVLRRARRDRVAGRVGEPAGLPAHRALRRHVRRAQLRQAVRHLELEASRTDTRSRSGWSNEWADAVAENFAPRAMRGPRARVRRPRRRTSPIS